MGILRQNYREEDWLSSGALSRPILEEILKFEEALLRTPPTAYSRICRIFIGKFLKRGISGFLWLEFVVRWSIYCPFRGVFEIY